MELAPSNDAAQEKPKLPSFIEGADRDYGASQHKEGTTHKPFQEAPWKLARSHLHIGEHLEDRQARILVKAALLVHLDDFG